MILIKPEKKIRVLHTFIPTEVHASFHRLSVERNAHMKDLIVEAILDLILKHNIKCDD